MTSIELLQLARQVLTLPTAPYHEHQVREFVIAYCRELGVRVETDRVGNVIARWEGIRSKRKSKRRIKIKSKRETTPLVFVAHMDHPGFEALSGERAEFLGGVPKELFRQARVRFYSSLECGGSTPPSPNQNQQSADRSARSPLKATITRVDERAWPKRKLVDLKAESRQPTAGSQLVPGDFGMWDLPSFRVRGGHLHAATIDDPLGVAVVLATLTEVVPREPRTHLWGVFTRAEEVGFHGATELARAQCIPQGALVVSVEMSRERPWARIGHGPIVRVGDRMTTFDADATCFLQEAARSLRDRDSAFRAQRCLMDGGTCEATAFAAFGYRVGGLCLPLGNYHNIGRNGTVRAEYVSVRDLERLLQLTVEAAAQWPDFGKIGSRLTTRIAQIRKDAPRTLARIGL